MGPVDSFSIDYSKSQLKELGPFSSSGSAAGIDIACDGATAFFGDAATNTEVEAYRIQSNGKLSELANYKDKKGSNSNNVMLSKDQKTLYVTNNQSNEISILEVGRNGVEFRQGIVKLNKPGEFSDTLTQNKTGTQVFVSEARNPESAGVLVPKGGSLKEVPGSPFGVLNNFFAPAGVVAVPGFSCK
jgi:6-phosphogluconolactonase (cycloisomerase 2 family)